MPSLRKLRLAALAVAAWPVGRAAAQTPTGNPPAGEPTAPTETAPAPSTGAAEKPADAPSATPAATPPATPESSSNEVPHAVRKNRWKPLQVSVGLSPTAQDLGSEADILGISDSQDLGALLDQWAMTLKGSIRVPIRIGFGPRNDGQEGTEMHSLPRIVGAGSGDWNYINLAPNASVGLALTIGNPLVSANIVYSTSHLIDPSYPVVNDMGLDQAYLALKFPDAFGTSGGIAVMAGVFSERFGTSGPYQKSSGYYSTYLFGRTHQGGESITADIDLSEKLELILEHGIGAKTEVVPFTSEGVTQKSDDFQGQGPQPFGSNFVNHAHAAIVYDGKLRIGAHYLKSWSPNDNAWSPDAPESFLQVVGGDVHLDGEVANAYVGYSHIDADELYPLADAVQVLHSGTGRSFKLNYFGEKERLTGDTGRNDSGTVDTVLTQFIVQVAALLDDPFHGRDLNIGFYSMWNHVRSDKTNPNHPLDRNIRDDKLKFGSDVDLSLLKFMSVGTRFDRVIPRMSHTADAYTAITPRMSFYTRYKSKEQVILSYTHFFLGPETVPGSPYTDGYYTPDADMIVLMARMSF